MIVFPNAKINLGLRILGKRPDGYHDISTVMMPVGWEDVLEIVPSQDGETRLHTSGNAVDCPPEKNLVMKAYRALCNVSGGLPAVDIYLKKLIPDGAGMGGGSADAAFTLKTLNELFCLGMDKNALAQVAAMIGADCPFFIYNRPMYCSGTGTSLKAIPEVALSGYILLIAKPTVASVSTAQAYAGAHISGYEAPSPEEIIRRPVEEWKEALVNDFEKSVFALLPEVSAVKESMYDAGAAYASMTGSGAAVYGLFKSDILAQEAMANLGECTCRIFQL